MGEQQIGEKLLLMPELSASHPWQRCVFCRKFDLWLGTLPVCNARCKVLAEGAYYTRRCSSWEPNPYCKANPGWSAKPAAAIVAAAEEFL